MRHIFLLAALSLATAAVSAREVIEFAPEWKFSGLRSALTDYPVQDLPSGYSESGFDDSGWSTRKVPANWCEDLKEAREAAYLTGVYRQRFSLPRNQRHRVLLRFDGAAYDTHAWVNGRKAGMHRGAYASFYLDITPSVRWGESNLLAIRCDYTNDKSRRAVLNNFPPPGDRAGLWGKVWLELVPELYIQRVLIDPDPATGTIRLRARVFNESGRERQIRWNVSVTGNASGDLGQFLLKQGENLLEGRLRMKQPKFWSHETPVLYELVSTLNDDTGTIDTQKERFGFSRFEIAGQRFRLNGIPIFLKARHFTGLVMPNGSFRRCGAFSMPWEEQKSRLLDLFSVQRRENVNMLRAHSAHGSPKFVYDAADEAGILIYQEWSTYGIGKNLRPEFLEDAAEEIAEWLEMVYNNPSVVMFSFANESPGFEEQTRCYEILKPRFGERFAFCCSSGFLPLLSGEIKVLPKTDLVDIHTYVGMSFRVMMPDEKVSWQKLTSHTREIYRRIQASWAAHGREFSRPYVAMEVPAGSWNVAKLEPAETYLSADGTIPPESYIRAKELSEQQGALQLGAWDLKNASLADKFAGPERNMEILNKIDKRSIEGIRRNPEISGLCVAGANRNSPTIQSLVYQDVLPVIEEQNFNWFAGDLYRFTLTLINDSPQELPAGEIRLGLRTSDGNLLPLKAALSGELRQQQKMQFEAIPAGTRRALPGEIRLREDLPPGDYRFDLEVFAEGKARSRNHYLMQIGRRDLFPAIQQGEKRIVLFGENTEKTEEMLKRFGIRYSRATLSLAPEKLLELLAQFDVALIAPATLNELGKAGPLLRRWVENGGELLSLELNGSGRIPFCTEWELGKEGPTWFVDIGPGEGHPISRNMRQAHFDSWNGNWGYLAETMILPMNPNMLAVGVCVESDQLGVPVAEAKLGKGRLMVSQLLALDRFMSDPAAMRYLHNLLDYFLARPIYSKVRPLAAGRRYSFDLDLNKCFFVDLRPYANRGFRDQVPGDHTGWTDQGDNDLRHIPQGRMDEEKRLWEIVYNETMRDKQIFRGVPFDVIDQKSNDGKSCIVLRGELRRNYPESVEGIKVGRKALRLYFLHTAVFGHAPKVAEYRLHYEDGSIETIELRGKQEIANWWGPLHLGNALMAWSGRHPVTRQTVGVYAFEYKNPHPEKVIDSIDFVSENRVVPILLAITGVTE